MYYNPDLAMKVAKAYFAHKELTDYYSVCVFNPEEGGEICYYCTFDPDDLEVMRKYRSEYGEDEFVDKLKENEPEVYEDLVDASGEDIIDVYLDDKDIVHMFGFAIKYVDDNGNIKTSRNNVVLEDEEYVQILAQVISSPKKSFRGIEYSLPEIARKINRQILNFECDMIGTDIYDYMVTLEGEVADDLKAIFDKDTDPTGIMSNPKYFDLVAEHCTVTGCRIHGDLKVNGNDESDDHRLVLKTCGNIMSMEDTSHKDDCVNVYASEAARVSMKAVAGMLKVDEDKVIDAIKHEYASTDGLSRFRNDLGKAGIAFYGYDGTEYVSSDIPEYIRKDIIK